VHLRSLITRLINFVFILADKEKLMAQGIDRLTADVAQLQAVDQQIITGITALNQKIADLQAALDGTDPDPAVSQAAAALEAEIAKLTAAIPQSPAQPAQ